MKLWVVLLCASLCVATLASPTSGAWSWFTSIFGSNDVAPRASTPQSLGDKLYRTYTKYVGLPTTVSEASAAGYSVLNQQSCSPALGIPYTVGGTRQSDSPLTLYFTPAGQIASVGVDMYGTPEQELIAANYWRQVSDGVYHIVVSFRNSDDSCSSNVDSTNPVGYQAVINQDTISVTLPFYESDTQSFEKGACFASMGNHYFTDLSGGKTMTWQSKNLSPIVPMYDGGQINAFFFTTSTVQQGLLSAHSWEPIPLINTLMCKNWCNSDCHFDGTHAFSTMHIYFKDPETVKCPNDCNIACCSA
jgi:hypothetical protein